jgi:hypothetical protein
MTAITIAYAAPDRQLAERLANDLTAQGYQLTELSHDTVLVAVISPDGLKDDDLLNVLFDALDKSAHIVLVAPTKTPLPKELDHLPEIVFASGYKLRDVTRTIDAAVSSGSRPMAVLTPERRRINNRLGWIFGGGIFVLFLVYTVLIVLFDIEAPVEQFERAYTRSAATVGAFAQPFVPRTTEQAENFMITLESRLVSDELATVIVQTATQAAAEGGFTPIPTGYIVVTEPISEVRMTATGGAVIRATETAQAANDDFDAIAATATQAAVDANAELQQQMLTVTAAAESD